MARASGGIDTQRPNQDSARNSPPAVASDASAGHSPSHSSASLARQSARDSMAAAASESR